MIDILRRWLGRPINLYTGRRARRSDPKWTTQGPGGEGCLARYVCVYQQQHGCACPRQTRPKDL